MTILSSLTGKSIESLVENYQNVGYGTFKKDVADAVCKELGELQAKVLEIQSSNKIEEILEDGAKKASYYAIKNISKVYRKVGLN